MKNKKLNLFLVFMLCGCQTPYYHYISRNTGESITGKSVVVLEKGGSVTNSRLANLLKNTLSNYNAKTITMTEATEKIANNKLKKVDYVATIDIQKDHWQTQKTVPIWGKTGISSINTTTTGNSRTNLYGSHNSTTSYNPYGFNTYGTFDAYANTNSYSNSTTNINYDYGITGYQNVIVDNYMSCVNTSIRKLSLKNNIKFENLPVIHESSLCIKDMASDDDLILYAQDVYNKNILLTDNTARYKCTTNGYVGICIIK